MIEPTLTNSVTSDDPVYFIADAHLGSESLSAERAKADELIALARALRSACSCLYLVGDIFDFWFEYPYPTRTGHETVLEELASLAGSGTAVHFLGGNHDYWAGRRLAALAGAEIHRRPIEAVHFGRRLFIAHGDGLPEGDVGYRALRLIIRSPLAIAGFSLIPPRAGAAIARWTSGLSEVTEERIDDAVPPMLDFMRSKLSEGFDAVIVGHVHHQLRRDWDEGTGIIVGDWMTQRAVVELGASGFRTLQWTDSELRERKQD